MTPQDGQSRTPGAGPYYGPLMAFQIEIPRLHELIVQRLAQKYSAADAKVMADSILFGELIGRPSHGISRTLAGSFGVMDEESPTTPEVRRLGRSSARITGGPGILVASMATKLVDELANEFGMAVVSTTGSHSTSGSLLHYVEQLTNNGHVAMIATNSVSFVAPPGGTERVLGTNPFAVGVPALGHPLVLDMSTAAITGGGVLAAARSSEPLPAGTAVDAAGDPTTDPQAVLEGGALLAFGGHKGLALSMMVQLLSGVFGGTSVLPIGVEDDWSHVFVAISLASFGDPGQLRQTAQELIDRIRTTATKDGAAVRIPGHHSLAKRDAAVAAGVVEIDPATYERFTALL